MTVVVVAISAADARACMNCVCRVKSTEIALEKAAADVKGAVLASDAFFPFSWNDSVEMACKAGVAAIAHPGGSIRDQDAVDCCNKYGVALVTTGVRHFKH
jgi:phosphoribosylaminoimidazolecarboxamide formyltransferase/IMP cyclohydrolase